MARDTDFQWSEEAVFTALEVIHPGPEKWTVVPGLPNATSWDKSRTCDAMAFGCWRSEGIAIHGYEIKVSRGDWLREIQDPEKGLAFSRRCNYWWIAAPDGVVKVEEMPSDWGLRVVSRNTEGGYSARVKKAATFKANPEWDLNFLVALARACYKKSPDRIADEKATSAAYEEGYKAGAARRERETVGDVRGHLIEERDRYKKAIADFETASGIRIDSYNAGQLGRAFQAFQQLSTNWGGLHSIFQAIEGLQKEATELAQVVGFEKEKPEINGRRKRRR